MAGRHRWAALRAATPVASRSVRAVRRQRRMICLPLHFALFPVLVAGSGVAPGAGSTQQVVRVPLSGTIEMGLAPFVERTLAEAAAAGADAVVLEIETPGGRVDAAERIANAIGRSPVPVHAWVNMHAYSAGAMIAITTDRIFMQPGAVIGAATPVDGSGARAPEKIVSAMRAQMRALAEAEGRDPLVAEAMVDERLAIEGVVDEGELLTLTTREATEIGYAETVDGWTDLLDRIGMQGAEVLQAEVNWAERLVRFFTNPIIAPFLLSLGFLGLLIEIRTAGLGLAGLAGLLSLGLFFGAHFLLGLAGAEDLILVVAGIVLIALEVFIVPGFGIFGIAGGLALIGGLFMAQIGALPAEGDLMRAATVLAVAALVVTFTTWGFFRSLFTNRRLTRSGIVLPEATDRRDGYNSADPRPELVGAEGVAITALRPAGVGLFADERLDVVSESEWIEEGTPIRVVSSEGSRHLVRPVARNRITES